MTCHWPYVRRDTEYLPHSLINLSHVYRYIDLWTYCAFNQAIGAYWVCKLNSHQRACQSDKKKVNICIWLSTRASSSCHTRIDKKKKDNVEIVSLSSIREVMGTSLHRQELLRIHYYWVHRNSYYTNKEHKGWESSSTS